MKNLMRPTSGLALCRLVFVNTIGAVKFRVRQKGTLMAPWSARDAAAWMSNWPPTDGELYAPIDVWDEEIAVLWLHRYKLIEELDEPKLIPFRGRRSPILLLRF